MAMRLMRQLAPVWLFGLLWLPVCSATALQVDQLTSADQKVEHPGDSIPEFSLAITCGSQNDPNPFLLTAKEKKSLAGFVSFIEDHQDSVVYVSVRIDQECASCGCPRSVARPVADETTGVGEAVEDAPRGTLAIDARSPAARGDGGAEDDWGGARMFAEGVLLDVNGVEGWAARHAIYLPRWRHLADTQYRAGEYGTFAKFDGLFTARFHGKTGTNLLHLDVVSPADRELAQLHRIRQRQSSAGEGSE